MQYDDGFVAYLNGVKWRTETLPPRSPSLPPLSPRAIRWHYPRTNRYSSFVNLLQNGNNVLAIEALNSAATDPDLLIIPEIVAAKTLASTVYYDTPTPGAANGTGFIDYVRDVHFSVDRGFYDTPFTLDITDTTPGATIVYTLDGSVPTLTHGTESQCRGRHTPPIAHVNISKTTSPAHRLPQYLSPHQRRY